MTQFLPNNLLALFAPRDPIPFLPPVDKLPYEKTTAGYTGISAFINEFENPEDTPPPREIEKREERQERKRRAKAELAAYKLEQDIALWSPSVNPLATSDPSKTLFVGRVSYNISESKLRREFEVFGPIKKIAIVHDKFTGKPRGYAFIEYERERDMHTAYKHADGKKIDGRRVLVDVERGRTVKGWLPRRLGGGLGGTRRGGLDINSKHSGREEQRLEDRYLDRERERPERPERPERRRSRSRSRDRRRRSLSRNRDRRRTERSKRDRSHDRERARERDGGPESKAEEDVEASGDFPREAEPRKERRRSRSRDRDRKRRRSRSRDRKRRDHDRNRESRRDRGDADRDERNKGPAIPEQNEDNFNNSVDEGEFNNYNSSSRDRKKRDHDRNRENRRDRSGGDRDDRFKEDTVIPQQNEDNFNSGEEGDYNNYNDNSGRDRKRRDHDRSRESRRDRAEEDRDERIKEYAAIPEQNEGNFNNSAEEGDYNNYYNNNMETTD